VVASAAAAAAAEDQVGSKKTTGGERNKLRSNCNEVSRKTPRGGGLNKIINGSNSKPVSPYVGR
jgi:hypothetical protein